MTNKELKKMSRITGEKISSFLWFDTLAEEAVKFYTSVFKNSKIFGTTRYNEASSRASGRPKGSVMTVAFQMEGQNFTALNGGPVFKFSPAVSFVVSCKIRKRSIIFGKNSQRAERQISAAGLMINTA
jgi:predicted 3-demethylubiquinone-9 3-methyltransferase (glyoxalase superfamily)